MDSYNLGKLLGFYGTIYVVMRVRLKDCHRCVAILVESYLMRAYGNMHKTACGIVCKSLGCYKLTSYEEVFNLYLSFKFTFLLKFFPFVHAGEVT